MSLKNIAAAFERNSFLELGLDSFGDHFKTEQMSETYRCPDYRDVGLEVVMRNEVLVELEPVYLETAQIAQGRIAGAEVVQRHSETKFTQALNLRIRSAADVHEQLLGDLEL